MITCYSLKNYHDFGIWPRPADAGLISRRRHRSLVAFAASQRWLAVITTDNKLIRTYVSLHDFASDRKVELKQSSGKTDDNQERSVQAQLTEANATIAALIKANEQLREANARVKAERGSN